jgi:hypothetical protein
VGTRGVGDYSLRLSNAGLFGYFIWNAGSLLLFHV